ncbi:methyltransferase family protein [Roseospira visakhapatnamensis]|uniref:Protein-S-isoprenylcysteine O-methyltransferase Ste14 n=1 Tax=Roseospira visakhapatnamensis TaxID=390880 RepID=A0A7W6WBX8_9PROT|nr:isoprenylcysteine carboxylmethyltransferase family protein [Roseospira visakhapatnamensis]MBB4267996.1 protein-S-isoprenylcysteine O-methyltransferase Ste14 [Roseospira visakhapatnamensis]
MSRHGPRRPLLIPPRLFYLALITMAVSAVLLPGPVLLDAPWHWLGAPPVILGAWLTLSGGYRFHRTGTNIQTFNTPTHLHTDGLFRWSRNPMYLGFALMTAGAALLFGTLTPLLLAVLFAVICDRWYIRFEERAMQAAFGDAYAAYRQRTRRWV